MKKYYSKYCKYAFVVLLIGLFIFIGAFGGMFFIDNFFEMKLLFISFGFVITLFAATISLAEKSRWIAMYNNELILPRGVQIVKSGEKAGVCTKRASLKIDEIISVSRHMYKGDKIILKDTYFYCFNTVGRKSYCLPLYSYGEKSIKEIMDKLSALGVSILFDKEVKHISVYRL